MPLRIILCEWAPAGVAIRGVRKALDGFIAGEVPALQFDQEMKWTVTLQQK